MMAPLRWQGGRSTPGMYAVVDTWHQVLVLLLLLLLLVLLLFVVLVRFSR